MSSDRELSEAKARANAMFAGVQLYLRYMRKCHEMIMPVLPRKGFKYRDNAVKAVWLRASAWMQSLELLNHTKHIQVISVANKSLLEFTMDLVLLHTDPTNNSGAFPADVTGGDKSSPNVSAISRSSKIVSTHN